ncbi:MAG TPA: branched-chain amino acid ABC transporter ATP-binding protein/permease [Acidimicrobiales bacterium]|nr:branched-chain amino acid ABC transporter ATP-binding protein/permease [Acidimicrobiales bacterium]
MTSLLARRPRGIGWLAFITALVFVLPPALGSDWDSVGTQAAIWAMAAIGLDLMWGLAGHASLGQQGFIALGAYAVAVVTVKWGWGVQAALVVSVLVAAVAALAIGWIALRLKEIYLALATLGFGLMIPTILLALEYTGKATGLYGIPGIPAGDHMLNARQLYLLFWGIALVMVVLSLRVRYSMTGLSWRVFAHNQDVAESCGVNTVREKRKAFAVGAGLTGLAGGLYAVSSSAVSPATFSLHIVLILLVAVVVGGKGTIVGPVVGAMGVSVALLYSSKLGGLTDVVFGLGFVLALKVVPGGFVQTVQRVAGGLRPRRQDTAHAPAVAPVDEATAPAAHATDHVRRAAPTGDPVLTIQGVSKNFRGVIALSDVGLEVRPGEIHGIVGPNGAGKSTLLAVVSGLIHPDAGHVTWKGQELTRMPAWRRASTGLARTFQTPQLVTDLTVRENVALGLYMSVGKGLVRGVVGRERARLNATSETVLAVLDRLGLAHIAELECSELSFGQLRLTEFARCLVREPGLLLLDEAASGLDQAEKALLVDEVRKLADAGTTVCLIEHDTDLVARVCDNVTVLDAGVVLARGTGDEIFRNASVQASYMGGRDLNGRSGITPTADAEAMALDAHDLVVEGERVAD